jgi:hypothetical protein
MIRVRVRRASLRQPPHGPRAREARRSQKKRYDALLTPRKGRFVRHKDRNELAKEAVREIRSGDAFGAAPERAVRFTSGEE